MEKASNVLRKRTDRLTSPAPTIKIFNGHEYYITDNGQMGNRPQIAVQLSVRFREKQLAQLKGPILAVFLCIALHINEKGQSWPSKRFEGRRSCPVWLRNDAYPESFGLEDAGNDGSPERGMVHVGVAGHQDEVNTVPAPHRQIAF